MTRRFTLSEKFLSQYKEKEVPWGPVGYVVFKRTYPRKLSEFEPGATGTEEWWQVCKRVIEGMFNFQKVHCVDSGLEWDDSKARKTAKEAYDRLFHGKWTPPGRGLWCMGTDFVENRTGAALFNCAFRSTKDISTKGGYIFGWIMDALMLGVGVGFDTLGAGQPLLKAKQDDTTFVIPDTREGWVESVVKIIDAYLSTGTYPKMDYSQIRKIGEPINGFGGVSSGPDPLIELHEQLHQEFSSKEILDSELIVDTSNLLGRCVVAGNIRRSAELSIGSPDDEEFINLKQDLEKLQHHRWCSNNSISAEVGMDYTKFAKLSATNGEPGYIWLENARTRGRFADPERFDDIKVAGFNPCVEQQLEDGELCCLVETYPARHESYEDFLRTLKIAYLYAKTVTLSKTHWKETNQIMLKNRRIGLSMTGFIQACNKFGLRNMFNMADTSYQYIKSLDEKYSDWLCIPRSKRMTSIKPSGTVSKLFGATPGCHYPEHEFYIQRILFTEGSPLLKQLIEAGYTAEKSFYYPNSYSVQLPVKEPYFEKGKAEVSMWEQLEIAAQLQHYWADNSVSVTVTFKEHEKKDIARALELYETRLKAVSFLQYSDTGYVQAPMEPITKETYENMIKKITPITKFKEIEEEGLGSKFCTNDSCEI